LIEELLVIIRFKYQSFYCLLVHKLSIAYGQIFTNVGI